MKWFLTGVVCLALSVLASAQSPKDEYKLSTAEVRKGVVAVINEQLADFRGGEAGKAYALAAARFKEQFPLERFAAVVQQAYPEIWANDGGQFGVVRDDGVSAVVTVQVNAKKGSTVAYDYFLLLEDSVWRIAGVIRHEAPKPSA